MNSSTQSPHESALPLLVIGPRRGWVPLELRDLWQYRDLLFFLAWRDITVRYKQTALGAAWAILQPFVSMVVFSVFFGLFIKVPSDGLPYPIFAYAALLPWQYFSTALASSGQSLIDNERLLTKVYFPRLIIPLASVLPAIIDFLIAFVVLIGMLIFYHIPLSINIVWLPMFLALALVTALGVGLWIATFNVQYRDFRYVIPFLVQLWLFVSPVTYSISVVPERWRVLYSLNPMVGVIEGFRWALLGTQNQPVLSSALISAAPAFRRTLQGAQSLPVTAMLASAIAAMLLLISGLYFFRRVEDSFADVV